MSDQTNVLIIKELARDSNFATQDFLRFSEKVRMTKSIVVETMSDSDIANYAYYLMNAEKAVNELNQLLKEFAERLDHNMRR